MKSQKMETDFLYSVGLAGFALLNADGSFPTPCNWKDIDDKGNEREHAGGIVCKGGPYDLSTIKEADEKTLHVLYGTKKESVTLELKNPNSTPPSTPAGSNTFSINAIKTDDMVVILNKAFASLKDKGIKLEAEKKTIDGVDYLKIYDAEENAKKKLPFYAPFGFSGLIANILGIRGYIITEEVKSVKHDFDKEQGKSVDITSGRGIRCVVKEADKIKGLNLTISMAGQNIKILSMITGSRYNEKADEFFAEGVEKVPTFAFIYFVKAFAKGENNEGSFEKVKAVCFPSCQATLPGDNAQEGAFSTVELQVSASINKSSNLPLTFNKGISVNNYSTYVESL